MSQVLDSGFRCSRVTRAANDKRSQVCDAAFDNQKQPKQLTPVRSKQSGGEENDKPG